METTTDRDSDALLTTPEAAALLGVPVTWLESAKSRENVPGRIKLGHYVRWHRPTLLDYLQEQAAATGPVVGRTRLARAQAAARRHGRRTAEVAR